MIEELHSGDEKAREEIRRAAMEKERAEMEAKLREELRAELLADMVKNNGKDSSDSGPQKK